MTSMGALTPRSARTSAAASTILPRFRLASARTGVSSSVKWTIGFRLVYRAANRNPIVRLGDLMIVITGATGTVGRALAGRLHGHDVLAAVRRPADLPCPYALADLERPETIGALLSPGDRLFLNSSLWPGFAAAHRA